MTYLGCILDEKLPGESGESTHVIKKVNSRLRFIYRQSKFLNIRLSRLLCNGMMKLSLIMHVTLGTLILTVLKKTCSSCSEEM